ncbi:MBL fold metallo-hydrolase [Prevotella sp. A2931]|uniref:MBL fold metallo-hydrolase n=1 Tax=Prevotella illustrans TaxID=2800387 RepID=A0ABS3M2E6_9BACT|nr:MULTISPECIES: MBL fold metallo-hydrolase [Prevotella]MBO1362366.1 MBL fold metallo-hydrolase [Prevotella illustrans]PTL25114.1 MBL fold metallo-hydrolase [Prevotella sp. oral taxon 820]
MLNFISFGSGSSGNCYLLYTETDSLLIDAGVGVRVLKKHMRNYGLSLSSIHHILITHDHADHIKSVGNISSEYDIPVYATKKVHSGIKGNYSIKKKVPSHNIHSIDTNVPFVLGDFVITAFTVPHDSSDNVGYHIVYKNHVEFCIMTDIGYVTDEMKAFIASADYLIIEANHDVEMLKNGPYPQYLRDRITSGFGHLNNVACGEAIALNATSKLKHIWLCHLSEENNHPILAFKTIEQILTSQGADLRPDYVLEVLKRKLPSGPYRLVQE